MMEMMIYIGFAILAGIFTTIEAAMNASLSRIVSPKIATLHNLIIGLLVILIGNLVRGTIHEYKRIIYVNPLWLFGGVFGTLIVYFCIKAVSRLGIATTLTIVVTAQLISSLLFDYFFLKQHGVHLHKIAGMLFLLLGTYLITK